MGYKYDHISRRKRLTTPKELLVLHIEHCNMDLRKWLRMFPNDLVNRWKILIQILRGLEFIHKKGMAHRDMKPDNVLIKLANGKTPLTAKISDFGLTKTGKSKDTSGTINYMAPEQMQGKSHGAKVDMWAVGIMMREMFRGTSDQAAAAKLAKEVVNDKPTKRKSAAKMIKLLKDHIGSNPSKRSSKPRRAVKPARLRARQRQRGASGPGRVWQRPKARVRRHWSRPGRFK